MRFLNHGLRLLAALAAMAVGPAVAEAQLWSPRTNYGQSDLVEPVGVAFGTQGRFWVSDSATNALLLFSASGGKIASFGGSGTGPGKFGKIGGVATDRSGIVYVADTANGEIEKFSSEGTPLSVITSPGRLSGPVGLAVDYFGNLYVTCSGSNLVEKYGPTGEFILSFGGPGSGNGQFASPSGISVVNNGGIVVADSGNRRLQRFTNTGAFLWARPTKNNEIPTGVMGCWDSKILVTTHSVPFEDLASQAHTSNLQVFHGTGHWVETLSENGAGLGQLDGPGLAEIAPNGDVLIVDRRNRRIAKYRRTTGKIQIWRSGGIGDATPPADEDIVKISIVDSARVSDNYGLALKSNGTVIAWGTTDRGHRIVPAGLDNVVDILASGIHAIALKADGTVVVWGKWGTDDSIHPGDNNLGIFRTLGDSQYEGTALRADGRITVWAGDRAHFVQEPDNWINVASGGYGHIFQRANGTVVGRSVESFLTGFGPLSGLEALTNVVQVLAGHSTSIFLIGNGTLVGKGYTGHGRLDGVGSLSGLVAITSGWHQLATLCMQSDGKLVHFGASSAIQSLQMPAYLPKRPIQLMTNQWSGSVLNAVLVPTETELIPPTSTHTVSPTTPTSTWHKTTPVNVNVTATDNTGGSGVKEIRYAVNMGTEQTVTGASASIPVSGEGIHSISYWAVDNAGNTEITNFVTVKIDKTAPTVSASVVERVFTATASDTLSGIKTVYFKVDNGATQPYTAPVSLSSNAKSVTVWAEDNAGNLSAQTVLAAGTLLKDLTFLPSRVPSGSNTTGTVTLLAPAPAGGLTLTVSSSDPAVVTVPATVTIPAGQTKATVTAVAHRVPGDTTVTVRVVLGDQSVSTGVVVHLPTPKSITVAPAVLIGGGSATGKITLSSKAPDGGLQVSLTSLDSTVATVPATVLVPAGAVSATFPVTTSVVAADRAVLLSATVDDETVATAVWVRSIGVSAVTLLPSTVVGGNGATVRVTLTRSAPVGGMPVVLTVSGAMVSVPATVTVPAGATSATAMVTTEPVVDQTTVAVRARLGGTSARADLTVTPARLATVSFTPSQVLGGTAAVGTVSLTGKAPVGGLVVRLRSSHASATVPATVTVPAGAVNATFPITTSAVSSQIVVTITAVQNRDTKAGALTVRP